MFDEIRCEYPLPLPPEQGELAGRDWRAEWFQTKDLGQGMSQYCIRGDGELWLVGDLWLRELTVESFQRDFVGTVAFYTGIDGKENDFWVEWKATFANGRLTAIARDRWEARDNAERLRQAAERAARQARTETFLKTWVGRFVYPGYAWLVGVVLIRFVARGAQRLSQTFDKLEGGAWRWAARLTPHGNPLGQRRHLRRYEKRRAGRGADASHTFPRSQ